VHANAERVASALRAGGASGEVRELDDAARSADDAANALGVAVGAIVKSLVFTADGSPLLVLASGDHQVDTAAVAALLGVGRVRRADPDVVRGATGFPIGGVSPIGHPQPLTTLVDTHLASFAVIWAAAGTPHTVFPTTYAELLVLTAGTPADVAAGP
jgi:prolyl-tRNA editing enzyme YbaK/EbsC (Cys-tRNA(Pro) deacylase)